MKNNNISIAIKDSRKWYLIDAKGKTLGRLSTLISKLICGKHKSTYIPYLNCGDYVIVINAESIKISGKKYFQKVYRSHSSRPGGLRMETFAQLKIRIPERILEKSVKGMVPKGSLGRDILKNLKIYSGEMHPHTSQNPKLLVLN